MKKIIFAAFIALFLISCSSREEFAVRFSQEKMTIQKLPSGKEIKILSIGNWYFAKDRPPALLLRYQTDIRIDDVDLLRKEVEEIWPVFRINVEKSGLPNAAIAATNPLFDFLFFHTSRSRNFVVSKKTNGTWDFKTWNRDYNNEAEMLAREYLENYKKGDMSSVVNLLHYPDSFTPEQLNEDKNGIARWLALVADKLGSLESYELNNNQISYLFVAVGTASLEYWDKHPFFYSLIYDVNFSKKGKGYLFFNFSIINDKLVIHSTYFGLPADNPASQIVIKELTDSIMKDEMNRGQRKEQPQVFRFLGLEREATG